MSKFIYINHLKNIKTNHLLKMQTFVSHIFTLLLTDIYRLTLLFPTVQKNRVDHHLFPTEMFRPPPPMGLCIPLRHKNRHKQITDRHVFIKEDSLYILDAPASINTIRTLLQ